jgi:hypothetical protein
MLFHEDTGKSINRRETKTFENYRLWNHLKVTVIYSVDVYPGSLISDTGSRIQKQQKKRGEKKNLLSL